MEEHGLHYHFELQLDKHIMVIADHNGAFPFIVIDKNVQYHPVDRLNNHQQAAYDTALEDYHFSGDYDPNVSALRPSLML